MIAPITDLRTLLAVRVRPFPTRPKAVRRVVRIEDTIVAVDLVGRVYCTRVHSAHGELVGDLRRWKVDRIADALMRLGVAAPALAKELMTVAQEDQRRESAKWQLEQQQDLVELGVPYTKAQVRKLQAIAEEPKRRGGRP